MRWIAIVAGGLMLMVAGIAAIGSLLPRNHRASRTLTVTRPPADVWPVLIHATEVSDVPVDVLERNPPHRLVTRVTEKEKNFGGTWVSNPIFRFVSRLLIGHHATMDGLLKQVAKTLNEEPALSGE